MQCPNDGATLQMTERHGVEIDYCPTCRGVWLDRGELDKIVDKASAVQAHGQPVAPPPQQHHHDPHYGHHGHHGHHHKKHRKESFLGDLFDF